MTSMISTESILILIESNWIQWRLRQVFPCRMLQESFSIRRLLFGLSS